MMSSKIFIIILGHLFIYPLNAHFFCATRLSLTNKGWQFTLFLYIDINQEASVSRSFKKQKHFWNMTFVINEDARFLSDWAVNYDCNFSVTSWSLSISRRGNLIRTFEFPIAPVLWTLEASFWIWCRHPLAQVALSALHSNEEVSPLCPMSHLHKAPSITVLRTLQGNHLACGSVPPWKTSRTKAMSYSHLVSKDTWHAARTQKKIVDQPWIVKWPPDYREVEGCFCIHKIDCFKFFNYIKNAEKVSYLPGQISFPGCRYSDYIIEYNRKGVHLKSHPSFSGLKGAFVTGCTPSYFGSASSRHERDLTQLLFNTTQALERRLLHKIMCILSFFFPTANTQMSPANLTEVLLPDVWKREVPACSVVLMSRKKKTK